MTAGAAYLGLAVLALAGMGVLHKLGDRLGGHPGRITAVLFATSLFVSVWRADRAGGWADPAAGPAARLALPFGVSAAGAVWAFQAAVRHGRIATSWLLLNLSVVIPTGLSAAVYGEPVDAHKAAALGLIGVAVWLMYRDRRPAGEAEAVGGGRVWLTLILAAFALNGLGDFGLRVLEGRGLAKRFTPHYLAGWYLAGAVGTAVALIRGGRRPTRADLVVGVGLGACSVAYLTLIGLALAADVPGVVAFPVVKVGNVCVVAAAGVVLFRERVGPAGLAGIALGLAAALLLALE